MESAAVLGQNYGDEGKGHIVDFLSGPKTLNVLFNGGAQRAHAVFLADGRSHIFRHFGSGTFQGARTLIANKFIINPIIFDEEFGILSKKTSLREVFVDPRCLVTTPYDMLINTFSAKITNKTNTVGFGINETIERSRYRQLSINAKDLIDKTPDQLKAVLEKIKNEWVPHRIKNLKLSIKDFNKYFEKRIADPGRTTDQYLNVIKFMLHHIFIWPADNLIDKFLAKEPGRNIVFEAGQGLLLDQNRLQYMPFLTRSNTGYKNIRNLMKTVKTDIDITTYLVTRSYLTRHGDGPMFNQFELPHGNISEPTNPENQYQGKMRYGNLDEKWYFEALKETRLTSMGQVRVAMTCLDHIPFKSSLIRDDSDIKIISNGPTERDIKWN